MENELKQIARKIAKFPDDKKLANAKEILQKLEAGERIVWVTFI